jgi:hypothetical protein
LGAGASGRPRLTHISCRRAEWVKDTGLESGFDHILNRIQHLAENGLTSLMVMHDFLSRRLAPLQDRPTRPAWMYTEVNDIMRLERGPGSSLDEALGHPAPYALGNIALDEAMSTSHQALSQVQRVPRCEGEDLADEHRCLQLWASMLKRTTVSKRVVARA